MKVLKFGGTSVGTVESLRNVKNIVESLNEPAIVIVSALGGLTDRLIATANMAAAADSAYSDEMQAIRKRHLDIINALIPAERIKETSEKVNALLDRLSDYYKGVFLIEFLPQPTLDTIVSFGERMSSIIVAAMLADARHYDSLQFVKTEKWFNTNIADRELTERLIKETFSLPLDKTAVAGGFISTDRDNGAITNLGRGGSDYTAALIAAALDADVLEIWTDVDGFMTADPRIIKEASVIPEMSFVESMELCSFGAKVIYPPTIYPVFHKNIPIKILNTFHPDAPGTYISEPPAGKKPAVRGVSSVKEVAAVTIEGIDSETIPSVNSRTYNAMARNGIQMYLVAQAEDSNAFTFVVKESDLPNTVKALKEEFAPELGCGKIHNIAQKGNLAIVVMVGDSIKNIAGLAARASNTLQRNGINVAASSDNVSETTIAHVVDMDDTSVALSLLHGFCEAN